MCVCVCVCVCVLRWWKIMKNEVCNNPLRNHIHSRLSLRAGFTSAGSTNPRWKILGKKILASYKNQNLNLPQPQGCSYLHSIYIVLGIISNQRWFKVYRGNVRRLYANTAAFYITDIEHSRTTASVGGPGTNPLQTGGMTLCWYAKKNLPLRKQVHSHEVWKQHILLQFPMYNYLLLRRANLGSSFAFKFSKMFSWIYLPKDLKN